MQGAPDTSIVDGSGIDLAKNVTAVQQYDQTHVDAVSKLCKAHRAQAQGLWQACSAPASRLVACILHRQGRSVAGMLCTSCRGVEDLQWPNARGHSSVEAENALLACSSIVSVLPHAGCNARLLLTPVQPNAIVFLYQACLSRVYADIAHMSQACQ